MNSAFQGKGNAGARLTKGVREGAILDSSAQGKRLGGSSMSAGTQVALLYLLTASCVTSGRLLNLSEPQLSHLD